PPGCISKANLIGQIANQIARSPLDSGGGKVAIWRCRQKKKNIKTLTLCCTAQIARSPPLSLSLSLSLSLPLENGDLVGAHAVEYGQAMVGRMPSPRWGTVIVRRTVALDSDTDGFCCTL